MVFLGSFLLSLSSFSYVGAQAQNQNQQKPKEYTEGELYTLRNSSNFWLDLALKFKVINDKKVADYYRQGMMTIIKNNDPKVEQYKKDAKDALDKQFKKEAKKTANTLREQMKNRRDGNLTKFEEARIEEVAKAKEAKLRAEFNHKLQIANFKQQKADNLKINKLEDDAIKAYNTARFNYHNDVQRQNAERKLNEKCMAIAALNGKSDVCGIWFG